MWLCKQLQATDHESSSWDLKLAATVSDGMRANTVGSNGLGTKSDRLMKEALLVYRIIINEKELSKILTGNNFAGQKWSHIQYW